MNAGDIRNKLNSGSGRAQTLAADKARTPEDKITELYLRAYARPPRTEELATAIAYLNEPRTDAAGKPVPAATATQENFKDLLWP